jgi:hypothetical protein
MLLRRGLGVRCGRKLSHVDLKDATLMILTESAALPSLAKIAEAAYDQLLSGQEVDYRLLDELVAEASGKGVLRAIRQKYGATTHEAIFAPILYEIDRGKPIPPRRRPAGKQAGEADSDLDMRVSVRGF